MTTSILGYYGPDPNWQIFTDNGLPGAGYKLWAFAAGTTTPLDTYTDPFCQSANTNPVVFDAAGRAVIVFKIGSAYKIILTDATGAIDNGTGLPTLGSTIWSIDNYGALSSTFYTVSSIADLKALNSGAYNFISVLGYYAAGDQGGGLFYWDSSSSITQDTGTVFYGADNSAGTNNGRYKRMITPSCEINVRWFGAKGDNSTNDMTAIAAADTYAQAQGSKPALYFPNGAFKINSDPSIVSLSHFASGSSLVCAALTPGIKPIIADLGFHFSCTTNVVFPAGQVVHAEWFSSTALGGGSADDTAAFQKALLSIATNGGTLDVAGASVYYKIIASSGPILPLASNLTIRGVGAQSCFTAYNAGSNSFSVFGATGAQLQNVIIDNIMIDGGAYVSSTLVDNYSNGITGAFNTSLIKNCKFQYCSQSALVLGLTSYACQNLIIKDNLLYQNSKSGTHGQINLVNGTYVDFVNNRIEDMSGVSLFGIGLSPLAASVSISDINIIGNKLIGCNIVHSPAGAIYASNVVVTGNKIDLSTVYGLNTPPCINFIWGSGNIRIGSNTIYPNLVYGGIRVESNASTAPNTLFFEIDNNDIFESVSNTTDPSGTSHSGIVIKDGAAFVTTVHDNNINVLNDILELSTAVSGSYGIAEIGSSWGGAATTVKYGGNLIVGWATPILTVATRTIKLSPNVEITGNLRVDGTLIAGTMLAGYINGLQIVPGTKSLTVGSGVAASNYNGSATPTIQMMALLPTVPTGTLNKNIFNAGQTGWVAWTSGNAGGAVPPTLSLTPGWFHVFLIQDSTGAVDVGIDTDKTAANLLSYAGTVTSTTWSWFRRIGSIYTIGTSGSYALRTFYQNGDYFGFPSSVWAEDYTNSTNNWYAAIPLVYVPQDIVTIARLNSNLSIANDVNAALVICNYNDQPHLVATGQTNWPILMQSGGAGTSTGKTILNDTERIFDITTTIVSSLPKVWGSMACDGSPTARFALATIGYTDFRGKDGF